MVIVIIPKMWFDNGNQEFNNHQIYIFCLLTNPSSCLGIRSFKMILSDIILGCFEVFLSNAHIFSLFKIRNMRAIAHTQLWGVVYCTAWLRMSLLTYRLLQFRLCAAADSYSVSMGARGSGKSFNAIYCVVHKGQIPWSLRSTEH